MKFLQTYSEYDSIILEKININSMIKTFNKTFNKKKFAKMIIISLLSIYSVTQATNYINETDLETEDKEILLKELNLESEVDQEDNILNLPEIKDKKVIKKNEIYKDPTSMIFSQEGWNHLRIDEGSIKYKGQPALIVYSLGDGKLTVGYGHAESKKRTKLKIGQKITNEQAQKYFIKDVNRAAKGVKRMFKKWKKQGLDIKLTQNQYDVLVSLAFNKGVSSLYKSDYIQELKKGNYELVADLIKKEGNSSKWKGIKNRRQKEAKKFLT